MACSALSLSSAHTKLNSTHTATRQQRSDEEKRGEKEREKQRTQQGGRYQPSPLPPLLSPVSLLVLFPSLLRTAGLFADAATTHTTSPHTTLTRLADLLSSSLLKRLVHPSPSLSSFPPLLSSRFGVSSVCDLSRSLPLSLLRLTMQLSHTDHTSITEERKIGEDGSGCT